MYRDANQYLETELYRKAYYTYENIIKGAGSYKQSVALKDEAQEKGTIAILVTRFGYTNRSGSQMAASFTSNVNGKLNELNNPFIKIIDPSTLSANIYEN